MWVKLAVLRHYQAVLPADGQKTCYEHVYAQTFLLRIILVTLKFSIKICTEM
jgi:hypothetical protein